jgi:arylformamidase
MSRTPAILDISVPVRPGTTPTWPGSPPIRFEPRLSLARGDSADDTTLTMNLHTGTHIDAPSHFLAGAKTVDAIALGALIGDCRVVSFEGRPVVTATDLEDADIPEGTTRLLLKTDNAQKWSSDFDESFVGLDVDAAKWIVARGIELVGNDYLSVQPYRESDDVHRTLLGGEVVIVEGLDLSAAEPGPYVLVCLPLKLAGVEGAPARAVLLPPGTDIGGGG